MLIAVLTPIIGINHWIEKKFFQNDNVLRLQVWHYNGGFRELDSFHSRKGL